MKPALPLLLIALMVLPSAAPAAKSGCGIVPTECEAWIARHAGGTQNIHPVIAAAQGRVFVASIQDGADGRMAAVHALDSATGARLWNVTFSDDAGPETRRIAASPDGSRVHIVGVGYVSRLAQGFLATFDGGTGELLWSVHWPLDSEGKDVWTDGPTVYAVGAIHNDYAVVAYDAATGAQQWVSTYDAEGGFNPGWRWWSYDVAFDVTRLGPDLYVTGVSAAPSGLLEYATLALDASTGAQRWVARSHATDASGNPVPSEAYDVEASPDGQVVYVLGNDGLHALDAETGAAVWQERTVQCRPYWPMFHEECDLAVTPDGARIVAFSHNDLAAYDARSGEATWHHVLRIGNDWYGLARAMVLSPDGSRVYLATPGGRDDYVTDMMTELELAYETQAFDVRDGTLAWRVTYGQHCCAVHGVAIDPDGGRVFVTGQERSVSNPVFPHTGPPQILTVAYDTNLGLETLRL